MIPAFQPTGSTLPPALSEAHGRSDLILTFKKVLEINHIFAHKTVHKWNGMQDTKNPTSGVRLVGYEVWNEEREGGETSFHFMYLYNMQKTGQFQIKAKKPINSGFILDRK